MLHTSIHHGDFIAFSNIRGTAVSYLHRIGDRRLFESEDSPHCMEIVCNHIPENLTNEAQFQVTGYHMGCYQHFTRNLDCLNKGIQSMQTFVSRSSRKLYGHTEQLFPPECVNRSNCMAIQSMSFF